MRWFLGSCLVTAMGVGWLPNTFAPMERLRPGFGASASASNLPMLGSGFPGNQRFPGDRSPSLIDRVGQPRLGHVSPSPMTG